VDSFQGPEAPVGIHSMTPEPECQTPSQMQPANACCRDLELAQELKIEEVRH